MKVVLSRDLRLVATHNDDQDVVDKYPGCHVVRVTTGVPMDIDTPMNVTLEELRAAACEAVDARAETRRLAVLTPGSGQMAAYQAKEVQAAALLLDPDPTEAEYPDVFNEIGITADTAHEVAMAVLAAAERWRRYGRGIEKARLAGKKAVAEAGDSVGVLDARDGVAWPEA